MNRSLPYVAPRSTPDRDNALTRRMTYREASPMNESSDRLIQDFSTFYGFNGHRYSPIADPRLKQRMIALVGNFSGASHDAWARYFLLHLQPERARFSKPLVKSNGTRDLVEQLIGHLAMLAPDGNGTLPAIHAHLAQQNAERYTEEFLRHAGDHARQMLIAYLQRPCFYAAKTFFNQRIAPSSWKHRYSLEECFQIASVRAAKPDQALRNFQFDRPHISIQTYTERVLNKVLAETVYAHHIEAKTRSASDEAILRYVSNKELQTALRAAGYGPQERECAYLVWQSFREIYATTQQSQSRLKPPSHEQLCQMGDRYNQRCAEFGLPAIEAPNAMQQQLSAIAQVIRSYRSTDAIHQRLLDTGDELTTDGLDQLIQAEEAGYFLQVRAIVNQALAALPLLSQQLLLAELGLELRQKDILTLLGTTLGIQKQYQLSRRIQREKGAFLQAFLQQVHEHFADWMQQQECPDYAIAQLKQPLEDLLQQHCKQQCYAPLLAGWNQLAPGQQRLLRDYFQAGQKATLQADVTEAIAQLMQALRTEIRDCLQLDLPANDAIQTSLLDFVEQCVQERMDISRPHDLMEP